MVTNIILLPGRRLGASGPPRLVYAAVAALTYGTGVALAYAAGVALAGKWCCR